MKKYFTTVVILVLSIFALYNHSQSEEYQAIGIGGGTAWGINESVARPMGFQGRLFYVHSLNNDFWLEGGVSYQSLNGENPDLGGYSDYKTSLIVPDIRIRWNVLNFGQVKIYPFVGLGLGIYNNTEYQAAEAPDAEGSGLALTPPIGLGISYRINHNFAIELSGQGNYTLSDRINPPLDDKNDGIWSALLAVSYNFGRDDNDTDGDGLGNDEEKNLTKTDPNNPDTDGDGLSDGDEIKKYFTDPLKADTDGDGLKDGDEVNKYRTDPLKADSDVDGLNDGDEVNKYNTDPLKSDTDGDGLIDGDEVFKFKTDPLKADTDGDGLKDGEEVNIHKTDPLKADTDGDGLKDGEEVNKHKTNPLKTDTDEDGLNDGDELNKHKTNPLVKDTDKGGVGDGDEVKKNQNPLDGSDDFGKKSLGPQEIGKKMVLEGVVFETGKSRITPESDEILLQAYETMVNFPDIEVMISGHTDNVGNRNKNTKLSQDRADAVKAWLVSKGINAGRIQTQGFGPDKPIAPNDTPENKQKNRRIEFERIK